MKSIHTSVRVLIYSQDGFGLGHLRRNLNISLQIKKRCPTASILIIADSPVAPFFKLPPKCDFIKLPTIVKIDTGVWRPNQLPMHYQELLKIRADIIRNVALSFKPHIFLVDHMPHGALGELAVPLEALKQMHPETRIVLGLRDILGAQDVIRNMWKREGAYDAAEKYYDAVYIYGSEAVFKLVDEYQFPEKLRAKTVYCGYVTRESGNGVSSFSANGNGHLAFHPAKEKKFILVTGGGGADASYFMDKFIDAARLLQKEMEFKALVSTGPFMHEKQFQLLQAKAANLPVQVRRFGIDSISLLKKADVVISMAGYNTISEIMRFRKDAIVIPRPGPSAEQTMRTDILTRRQIIRSIHPKQLTSANLASLVVEHFQNGKYLNEENLPELNGASRAAELLLSLVQPVIKW